MMIANLPDGWSQMAVNGNIAALKTAAMELCWLSKLRISVLRSGERR
jgi:hypothetical protein